MLTSIYLSWFRDPELVRRVSVPTPEWLHYVTTTPGVFAWLIYHAAMPVGQIQLDTMPEHLGSLAYVVNPTLRRRGYGTAMLKALLSRPEAGALKQIDAAVEPDNIVSRRCLEAAGFVLQKGEPDHDGLLHYIYE